MQNSPKSELPAVYTIEPQNDDHLFRATRNKDIKSLYIFLVIVKCLYDMHKFWAFYKSGMSTFYVPTVFDFFADLVLLSTAFQPEIRYLKYIEVFSDIFLKYYLFAICLIPILPFIFNKDNINLLGDETSLPIKQSPFIFYTFDLTLVQTPRDFKWLLILLETEIEYAASALVASMFVYSSKHLAEHLIVQKRCYGRRTVV